MRGLLQAAVLNFAMVAVSVMPMRAGTPSAPLAFEVATIKPSTPGGRGGKNITFRGRLFVTTNTSLGEMLRLAYGLSAQQVIGAPGWLDSELYDIVAKPERDIQPTTSQVQELLSGLLAERLHLRFHRETRELSAYELVTAKDGPKLTKNTGGANLPNFNFNFGHWNVQNATMADLIDCMQREIFDRPAVDHTGLAGRFDFKLDWTPDETQYGGRAGNGSGAKDNLNAPPDLFTAIRQELGLKLNAVKTGVNVIVIDHVEKPSDN